MPTAMPDGSGNLAEQDLPVVKAHDNGNEPLSGSDQDSEAEHEAEAEAEAEVAVKKKRYVRLAATNVAVIK